MAETTTNSGSDWGSFFKNVGDFVKGVASSVADIKSTIDDDDAAKATETKSSSSLSDYLGDINYPLLIGGAVLLVVALILLAAKR